MGQNPATRIRIVGINVLGSETGNAGICQGRDLPWLQDTAQDLVWTSWGVVNGDVVVVVDADNVRVMVYDVGSTQHDLTVPANYDELKAILLSVAGE
ncbi:MAG: hypothetical protein ACE5JG_08210 [Planctomycetota bacterium]